MFNGNKTVNTSICYLMVMLLIIPALSFSGCSKKSEKPMNNKVAVDINRKEESINEKTSGSSEDRVKIKEEVKQNKNIVKEDSNKNIKFIKHKLDNKAEPKFNTKWGKTSNNKLSACIEGKGPDAEEEGIGEIYIKDLLDGEMYSMIIHSDNKHDSPKLIEWIDDENLLVIIGNGFGTVSLGGNLYKLNVKNLNLEKVYDTKSNKKQVVNVKKNNNKLDIDILVYEDDQLMKSHRERKTIDFK